MTQELEVAYEIMNQINVTRLQVMTGARNFIAHTEKCGGLSFRLPKFSGVKINYVKIILNANDLYDIEFGKVGSKSYKVISEHEDIFAEDLVKLIETETGLALSL